MTTSRLELLHNAVWQSRAEIRWDLDTIGWRAMTWGADGMTSTTELTSSPLQMREAATGKARLPTVESLTESTTRRLVPAERSVRRPCRSATGTSGPRYRGACMNDTLYSWTFKFHKVVQQQNSGAVEDFILPYSAVCLQIQKSKNYWNRSTFAKVIVKIKVAPFYGPQCRIHCFKKRLPP